MLWRRLQELPVFPLIQSGDSDIVSTGSRGKSLVISCNVDKQHLAYLKETYDLDDQFRYLKKYVRFHRTPGLTRKSMTHVSQPLLQSASIATDSEAATLDKLCAEPLEVPVTVSSVPAAVNASQFVFAVSTTYHRFTDTATTPIAEWEHWLTDGKGNSNGAKMVLMLLEATDEELQEVANQLGDVGIDSDVYHSRSSVPMAARYFSLIPTVCSRPDWSTRSWVVLCDDDTFFPAMQSLVERFEEFNHSQALYVGTLSEDVGAIERHGSQAFGSAGVFISMPMAQILSELYMNCTSSQKVRESDTGWGSQGDTLLRKCIYENTDVRLKIVNDLWQLDITGDSSGFYESGTKALSLHHYRSSKWARARPSEFTKVAHVCGEDCVLQRFHTQDNFILSGHSIAHYPRGIDFDWDMIERTMKPMPEDRGWNLDLGFGPQRPSLSHTGKKIAWELEESHVQTDGSVLQTYTRRWDGPRWTFPDGSPISGINSVIELVWIPA